MPSPSRIRSGFNFLSPFYDFFTFIFFGNKILKSQIALLKNEKYNSTLIFGGGTGKLLIALLKKNFSEKYCYVDISDKMIARAQKKVKKQFPEKLNQVEFIRGSYNDIPAQKFDAIFTPYVLDCFKEDELPVAMNALDKHLSETGKWHFSDFNIPAKEGKRVSKIIIRTLYFFFNMICGLGIKKLPDFQREFARLCYNTTEEKYFIEKLLVSRIYERGNFANRRDGSQRYRE